MSLLAIGQLWAEEPATPASIYKKYCSVCHGKGGGGKSSVAQGMIPPPKDFTTPDYSVELSRERMLKSVAEGRPKTAMVAWKSLLKPEEIAGVVDYIQNTMMPSSRAKASSPGRSLFAKNCSVCHGDRGDVAVWAQNGLNPSPRNFTTDNARWELTEKRMLFSIFYGRPETAMPSWLGRLTAEEIKMVISYIREAFMFPEGMDNVHLAESDQKNNGHRHDHYDATDMLLPIPKDLIGDVILGKRFYEEQCATCHGKKGDGKGPRADFIFPKPRDFFHPYSQQKFNRPHLFEVIAKGIRGSEMSAWDKVLTDQELANLAEYVFQAFIHPTVNDTHGPTQEKFANHSPGHHNH